MLNFLRIKKLRKSCRLLAIEWVKSLSGASEEQALRFVENSFIFDNDVFFSLERTKEYNTDFAIIRTLDFTFEIEIENASKGLQIYTDLKPGVIGIRSLSNLQDLALNFSLGAKYVSHLMAKIEEPLPEGFLTSTILNTEINLLNFVGNFYKWKTLPVALSDGAELPLEVYLSKASASA